MRQQKETTIIIKWKLGPATTLSSGIEWKTNLALVGRNKTPKIFLRHNIRDLSNTTSIKIFYETRFRKKQIKLPERLNNKLIQYFKEKKFEVEGFDCASFVHFLYDLPYEDRILEDSIWSFLPFNEKTKLQIGDVILISQKQATECKAKHMAIYLTDGIFISKFGYGGSIIFATLEEMKRGFSGNFAEKLIIKSQNQYLMKS